MSLGFKVGHLFSSVMEVNSCKIPSEFIYFHSSEIFRLSDFTYIRIGWFVGREGESNGLDDSSHG